MFQKIRFNQRMTKSIRIIRVPLHRKAMQPIPSKAPYYKKTNPQTCHPEPVEGHKPILCTYVVQKKKQKQVQLDKIDYIF